MVKYICLDAKIQKQDRHESPMVGIGDTPEVAVKALEQEYENNSWDIPNEIAVYEVGRVGTPRIVVDWKEQR